MSMHYKCTVIFLDPEENNFVGSCENEANEEVHTIDLPDLNNAWKVPSLVLVGNYICTDHMNMMDEI